jgi:hypothetical protein
VTRPDALALSEERLDELRVCLRLDPSALQGQPRKKEQYKHAFHPETRPRSDGEVECRCKIKGSKKWLKNNHVGQVRYCKRILPRAGIILDMILVEYDEQLRLDYEDFLTYEKGKAAKLEASNKRKAEELEASNKRKAEELEASSKRSASTATTATTAVGCCWARAASQALPPATPRSPGASNTLSSHVSSPKVSIDG